MPNDEVKLGYLEWLAMEARLLRMELFGDAYAANQELTPCGTFAKRFHFPIEGSWQDIPKPSTRAEAILSAAGVDLPEPHPTLDFFAPGSAVTMKDGAEYKVGKYRPELPGLDLMSNGELMMTVNPKLLPSMVSSMRIGE